jgi:Haem-binding domain
VKAFFAKHPWLCGGGLMSVLAVGSMAVHPFGTVKRPESAAVSARSLRIAPQIAAVLKRSCMDCHSNQTVWPWYSYVVPMSWLVERDVRRGRDHMNFSEWDQYTFNQQEKLLADIATAVKNREMPLPQYTLIHHDAKLSDADTDLLYSWARVERRRVKSSHLVVHTRDRRPADINNAK